MTKVSIEEISALAKSRGFIYQGSDIYDGLAGTWDYGPLGVEMKQNIKDAWWQEFVHARADMFGVDASILMSPQVWKASGHAAGFSDPLVEDEKTNKRFRADHLLEDAGVEGAEGLSPEQMNEKITELELESPDGNPLGKVKQFNMMFETQVGPTDSGEKTYLRPETAQGMFANLKNIIDSFHPDIPFGMAQIGKAFRNEITPRNYLFRTREFEQMEIEYFFDPENSWEEHFKNWHEDMRDWMEEIGLDMSRVEEHEHSEEELSHYSKRTVDNEFRFPFGTKELTGLSYRTDFDLQSHIDESGEKLSYYDQKNQRRFVPHVIEPTWGLDRLVLALLISAYKVEEVDGNERTVLKLDPEIAPTKVAILPLQRKDGLPEKALEVFSTLQGEFVCQYDKTASIGKRYRRQDEIGTPFCITIDYDTMEDDTLTVRDRDTMKQERVAIDKLVDILGEKLDN